MSKELSKQVEFRLSYEDFLESLQHQCSSEDECRFRSRQLSDYFTFINEPIRITDDYMIAGIPEADRTDADLDPISHPLLVG